MLKKIKRYFALQKAIQIEILETLCTVCKYLEQDSHYLPRQLGASFQHHLHSHFIALKSFSEELRYKDKLR